MKVYNPTQLRNVALIAHQSAGKTTLAEAMLFSTGANSRMGDIAQGSTVSDYDEEEQRRGLSLHTSMVPVEADGLKINLLDTPGYTDFQGEVKNAIRVSDLALVVIDASTGVQVGTEVYWGFASELDIPKMVVFNKINRDSARTAEQLLSELAGIFDERFVALNLPLGRKEEFNGVIDLLGMQTLSGMDATRGDIPAEVAEEAEAYRLTLMEAAAEANDDLLEKYFDAGELSDDEICQGVRAGIKNGTLIPVVFTAADEAIGVKSLTGIIKDLAPMPTERTFTTEGDLETILGGDGPLTVYVFKTSVDPYVGSLTYFRVISGTLEADNRYHNHTKDEEERFGTVYVMRGNEQIGVDTLNAGDIGAVAKLNVTTPGDTLGEKGVDIKLPPLDFPQPIYAVAVTPATQADSAKMGPILTRLCDEDQTLQWRQDPVTNEAVLEGMGDVHIDVAIRRAAHLGVGLETALPKVPYRETVSRTGTARYRHKKQSGGAGQFGEVQLRVEPRQRGEGFEFDSEIFGGAISHTFIPSIEKGIKQVMQEGVIAGYPVVDVKAVVFDGKEHPVDSKDIAFQIAGREAFKLAVQEAKPVLLEPIMRMRVTVPEMDMGSVLSDLSSRRGQVEGTDITGGKAIVTALIPLANIQRYSNDLRSFTQGRGVYTLEMSHYAAVPSNVAQEIIDSIQRDSAA
ncbi:MAG: elongation factor G [Anaerolineae bacterium]